MSYQVIARKYRPQRFEDVVGQEHVTQTLANAISSGRIAHAYLFCGPRGTGKTTLARIFAKALNCTGGPNAQFDDQDNRVKEIAEGRSLDVLEIDGASNNGVEQVRELRDTARFAPASSKFKIYIIDEVHMLSTAAFNALLKTLEEPPPHVKFLFATTDPEKVLPTILSRCQRFDLRRIPAALIVKHLGWIAGQEGVQIEDAALHAIARGADGGMRDAESALDQLISFCGNRIAESDVLSMFGLAGRSQVLALTDAILGGRSDEVLRLVDQIARAGKDLGRMLSDVLHHFHNLLLLQLSRGDQSLLEVTETELKTLQNQLASVESGALVRVLEVLSSAESRLREATARRIFLEVTLLRAVEARNALSIETVLKELKGLRASAGTSSGAAHAPTPIPTAVPGRAQAQEPVPQPAPAPPPPPATPRVPAKPEPGPASLPASGGDGPSRVPDAAQTAASGAGLDPMALWPELLRSLGPLRGACLEDARPIEFKKGILTIGFPVGSGHVDLAREKSNVAVFQQKLRDLGAGEVGIKVVESADLIATSSPAMAPEPAAPAASPAPAPTAPAAPMAKAKPAAPAPQLLSPEQYKNDPLIQQALEVFKAEILEVRAGQ